MLLENKSGTYCKNTIYSHYVAKITQYIHYPSEIVWLVIQPSWGQLLLIYNTSMTIRSAISGHQGDKSKCSLHNRYSSGRSTYPKNTIALNQGGGIYCPSCNNPFHQYKEKIGVKAILMLVNGFPALKVSPGRSILLRAECWQLR